MRTVDARAWGSFRESTGVGWEGEVLSCFWSCWGQSLGPGSPATHV